jgi:FkbM family methyltransferase
MSLMRNLANSIRNFRSRKVTYSQYGEDRIIEAFLPQNQGMYIDIGSGRPKRHSNSFLFYKKGWSGTCIDANPINGKLHKLLRPRDRVVTAFCARTSGDEREFLVTAPWQFSSGDPSRVAWIRNTGVKIRRQITIPTTKVMDLDLSGFSEPASFLSIDIEGSELEVLEGIDWSAFRPSVICVENLGTATDSRLEDLLMSLGYINVAQAVISRIFVLESYGLAPRL